MKNTLSVLILSLICSMAAFGSGDEQKVEAAIKDLPNYPGPIQILYFHNKAYNDILQIGIPAVEFLIPHLADAQLTKTTREPRLGRQEQQVSVGELVILAITKLTGHHFYIASGDNLLSVLDGGPPPTDPQTIKAYQDQIREWCLLQGNRKEPLRRLQDIGDGCHLNRFNAYEYFEKTGDPIGRPGLKARVEVLLADPTPDSLKESELVSCSKALASIGNNEDLPLLKNIWEHLFGDNFNRYMTAVNDIFHVANARIKLGDKEQVKTDLNAFKERYFSKLQQGDQADFKTQLEKLK